MNVSHKAVSRLSLYRSALLRFKAYDVSKIYSCAIAEMLGFTTAQVRKDFSMFRFAGVKKIGYDIDQLITNIDRLLQKDHSTAAILCGTGSSGYTFFIDQLLKDQGISIAAAFDDQKHPSVTTTESGIPVLPLEILIPYITVNMVKFAIIATSGKDAQRMLDMLVLAGIKGVLNLTGTEIKAPKRCIINTISVVREFDKLIYFVKNSSDKKKVKK